MAVSPRPRAVVLLLLALVLVISGSWVATSTATPAPSTADRAGTLIKYHGTEAKAVLPLKANRLPGAPRAFRRFVKETLQKEWRALGHTQACKTSPIVTVEAIRTDGFALGGVVTRPRRHCLAGGGFGAIWAIRHDAWKVVIGFQDTVACKTLEKFGIPSEIGVHECYDGAQVVPYEHP